MITLETIQDLKDETKTFVVFLWENDRYHALDGKQYREYDLRARGLFLLENGKLLSPACHVIDAIYRRAVTADVMDHYDEIQPFIQAVKDRAVFLSGAEGVTLNGNSLECSGEKLVIENCNKIEIRES